MCGIAVYYNKNGITGKELRENLESLKLIRHRGPDGEGAVLINVITGETQILSTSETPPGVPSGISPDAYAENSAHLFIGHRRLSIIDTSIAGHQPMCYRNRYWITFNGEVYNYIEVKKELEALGYNFITHSDTEVILAAYDAWKEKAVPRFNGMFSFLIYDLKEKELFAVNDRYGVKPLYWYKTPEKLIFMSELKQMRSYSVDLTLNKQVFKVFLKSSYLDYDLSTAFNEVTRFSPSHFLSLKFDADLPKETVAPYYELSFGKVKTSIREAKEKFNVLFNQAVNLRLRSDVPLGCSLSGGLDSSSILVRALKNLDTQENVPDFNTFSVIFPGLNGDESKFIYLLANQLKVRSHYVNALDEFSIDDLEKHIYHQDFPVQSTSYYAEWCLAKKVRESNVTVLLNGQGGDELLAGYHHHFYRYCRQLILSGKVLKYLSQVNKFASLKEMSVAHIHRIVLNNIKLTVKFRLGLENLGSSLSNKWAKADTLIELLKLDFKEYMLPTYLRSDDRDFMAHSVETRHPFLDFNLVDFCFSLPDDVKIRDGWQKWLLREAVSELPDEIRFRRDKNGYRTPQEIWLEKYHQEFSQYLEYIPEELKEFKSHDAFLNYALGAWFKINVNSPHTSKILG